MFDSCQMMNEIKRATLPLVFYQFPATDITTSFERRRSGGAISIFRYIRIERSLPIKCDVSWSCQTICQLPFLKQNVKKASENWTAAATLIYFNPWQAVKLMRNLVYLFYPFIKLNIIELTTTVSFSVRVVNFNFLYVS